MIFEIIMYCKALQITHSTILYYARVMYFSSAFHIFLCFRRCGPRRIQRINSLSGPTSRVHTVSDINNDGGGESNMGEIEMISFIISETSKGKECNPT